MRRINRSVLSALVALSALGTAAAQGDSPAKRPYDPRPGKGVAVAPVLDGIDSARARRELERAWGRYRSGEARREHARRIRGRAARTRQLERVARTHALALRHLERARRAAGKDMAAGRQVRSLDSALKGASARAWLDLASAYATRGSYRRALDAIDQALLLDDRNYRARMLLRHVQLAQAAANRR